MRLYKCLAIAVISCSFLGYGDARADKAFAERCIALKARLAKLNCRDGLREVELLLADSSGVFREFQSQLKTNRNDVVALASVVNGSTELARDCLVKHANEKRPFDKAYTALVELHSDMERWLNNKWEMPADLRARSDRQIAERQQKALNALVAVGKTW
jgi:hypothetical protein